jgi:hypothetical protein
VETNSRDRLQVGLFLLAARKSLIESRAMWDPARPVILISEHKSRETV